MPVFAEDIAQLVPHLRRFARALVCGQSAQFADDLVQETVVLAMRAERIAGGIQLPGWCYATLMRVHRLRRQGVGSPTGSGDQRGLPAAAEPSVPFLPKPIVRLDLLTLDCREVLLLTVVAGLSYAQAAEALHVTVDTVLSRLDTARAFLGKTERTAASGPMLLADQARPARHAHHLRLVK